jgi:arylsulfatase A-like enzyme
VSINIGLGFIALIEGDVRHVYGKLYVSRAPVAVIKCVGMKLFTDYVNTIIRLASVSQLSIFRFMPVLPRITFIASLCLLTCLCSLPLVVSAERAPNVVFIFCDDLGWGDLGSFGNTEIATPHIDGLAREGVRLGRFYVNSPVCSPSRAALLTGRFPGEVGIHYAIGGPAGDQYNSVPWLDPDLPTVYDVFKDAGYVTGHYGKWHIGHGEGAPPPAEYGLEVSGTSHSTGPGLVHAGEKLTNANKSEIIANRAVEFIEAHAEQPFFLSLWIMDPHSVLDPTAEQMEPYLKHTHPQVMDSYRSSMTVYYAIISAIDTAVGRVVEALEAQGLSEDTIIVFTSDNGPSPLWSSGTGHAGAGSAGPFRGVKGSLYEGGIRLPFIVRWPGQVPSNYLDMDSIVSAVDMPQTLAKMAGVDASCLETITDGEDRSAVLLGQSSEREKALYWDYRFGSWGRIFQKSPRLALMEGDWKLLMNPDSSRVELFNLKQDPMETSNRADIEGARVADMAERLQAWAKDELMDPDLVPQWSGQLGWLVPLTIKP